MMNTSHSSFRNPYLASSSAAPSAESTLRSFLRCCRDGGSITPKSVRSVLSSLRQQRGSLKWTLENVQDTTRTILETFRNISRRRTFEGNENQALESIVYFAARMLEEWPDDQVYAALILQEDQIDSENQPTLLNLFVDVLTNTRIEEYLHFAALVGLTYAYRVLERIQQLTILDPNQVDTSWWIDEENFQSIASLTVQHLKR